MNFASLPPRHSGGEQEQDDCFSRCFRSRSHRLDLIPLLFGGQQLSVCREEVAQNGGQSLACRLGFDADGLSYAAVLKILHPSPW
jgi:hypothetical protein